MYHLNDFSYLMHTNQRHVYDTGFHVSLNKPEAKSCMQTKHSIQFSFLFVAQYHKLQTSSRPSQVQWTL